MNNCKNFFKLNLEEQKTIINSLHYIENKSLAEMSELLGTYPNKIRRWALKNQVELRDKSQAQKTALQTGKLIHPTKGKQRSKEEKEKISGGLVNYWSNLDEDSLEERKEISRKLWDKIPDEEKKRMQSEASRGRIEAAKNGSKLEKEIMSMLIRNKHKVLWHQEYALLNEKLHLDLVIPEMKTAIEVDGPTHFLPIFGQDNLEKTQETDRNKDGLLLNSGYNIIRIRQIRNISKKYLIEIEKSLISILEEISKSSKNKKYIIGEVDD